MINKEIMGGFRTIIVVTLQPAERMRSAVFPETEYFVSMVTLTHSIRHD
jgi:hypothetical protein